MPDKKENLSSSYAVANMLDRYLENWLRQILDFCSGGEQTSLIELVRSADIHAYYLHCCGGSDRTSEGLMRCKFIIHGIGPILKAFLPILEGHDGPMRWLPSNKARAQWADQILYETGRLSMLRRLSHGERYGLVRGEVHSNEHVALHLQAKDYESQDRDDHIWLINKTIAEQKAYRAQLDCEVKGWARDRIDSYVSIDKEHFIRYDSDRDLLELYQAYVGRLMIESAESDTFPDDVRIGPRTFGEWKRIATTAAARACLHLSFATRLQSLCKGKLDLRNLLTGYARIDDLREVWREQFDNPSDVELNEIEEVFMFSAKHANEYFANNDCPLPYNIRVGSDFTLFTQFGYLSNTCAFLVAGLKNKYRKDWDSAVNFREAKFQDDLYALFHDTDYVVGRKNVPLRRADGGMETDIDATLFEKSTNCLYLFQLKWLDVFAHNLRERHSKLSNLLEKGNKWVDQICQWIEVTSRKEILRRLNLTSLIVDPATIEIRIIMLTRFSSRFSGTHNYDDRAAWLSWPALCRAAASGPAQGEPLGRAWSNAIREAPPVFSEEPHRTEYVFPHLLVDLYG